MSDRDVIDRIFEALCEGFADSEFTVSKMGDKVFLSRHLHEEDQEWCLAVYPRVMNGERTNG